MTDTQISLEHPTGELCPDCLGELVLVVMSGEGDPQLDCDCDSPVGVAVGASLRPAA